VNDDGPSADVEPVRLRALVVAPQPLGDTVAHELAHGIGDLASVEVVASTAAALASVERIPTAHVAMVVIASALGAVDAMVAELDGAASLEAACTLLVTDRSLHDDAADAIDRDRLDAIIAVPWTAGALSWHARSQLARWLRDHRPDDPRTGTLIDEHDRPLELPSSELLRDLELPPREVTLELLAAIERELGPRPRLRLPAGTRLTHQDRGVDGVLVVLSGSVALDRSTPVGELRLHHGSTGPVIGLLALAQQRRAFFTARSTTEVEVVHLSLEQLDRALRNEPHVGAAMAAVSIRALAQRLRRAEQLQVEKIELNRELDAERQRLADALHQLEQARLELVEQARFATLGELAAGIAHELNNPIAALSRAASYVVEDLDRVLASHPQGDLARDALAVARDRPPRSTADERAARRRLDQALGDRELARRLFAAGVEDPDAARDLAARGEPAIELTEAAAGIGGAVHNLDVASRRVSELVASLRAYARPDGDPEEDVDLHAGLDDTLRLTSHRLRGIEVERHYAPLPLVRCHPGQLGQVWTNLLVNAAEELGGSGRIEIRTEVPDSDHVRVHITDDGPGIDPEVLPRVFEPRFTTKQGTVRYGLGLGLAISRRIVEHHGGTIELTSEPGRTLVTVTLPVGGPPDDPSARRSGS
jgi:two-component system, NtrC family, sensor kinase